MTKTIKDIIEMAVEGGYLSEYKPSVLEEELFFNQHTEDFEAKTCAIYLDNPVGKYYNIEYVSNEQMVLDPLFWQALGKQAGWESGKVGNDYWEEWKNKMQGMVEFIIETGKTPQEYLLEIVN